MKNTIITLANATTAQKLAILDAYTKDGKIAGVAFIKKDGTRRIMGLRFGVSKGVKGTAPEATAKRERTLAANGMLTCYDMNNGFRTVNLNTTYSIKCGGVTYKF